MVICSEWRLFTFPRRCSLSIWKWNKINGMMTYFILRQTIRQQFTLFSYEE